MLARDRTRDPARHEVEIVRGAAIPLGDGGELAGFVPLVKESTIRFRRPALGVVRATASLSDEEVARVRSDALASGRGEFVLEATLTDAAGEIVATTVGTYQVRRLG